MPSTDFRTIIPASHITWGCVCSPLLISPETKGLSTKLLDSTISASTAIQILSSNTTQEFHRKSLNTQVTSAISPADAGPRLHQTASMSPTPKEARSSRSLGLKHLQNAGGGELTPYFTNEAEIGVARFEPGGTEDDLYLPSWHST